LVAEAPVFFEKKEGRLSPFFYSAANKLTDFKSFPFSARSPNREASALANELPEESVQFRFLRAACLMIKSVY
jgi:hypothetical protein